MKQIAKQALSRLKSLIGLALLVFVLSLLSPHFLTTENLLNITRQVAVNAILATGMTFVIISAGIDLSVGSVLALSGCVMAIALNAGGGNLSRNPARRRRRQFVRPSKWFYDRVPASPSFHCHLGHDEHCPRAGACGNRRLPHL